MTRRGAFSLVVVSGLVAVLAWMLVSRGMALVLAKRDPAAALWWHSGNPEALLRVNEYERNDAVKSARARAVLARRPMDGRAYRQLAEVEAAAGHHDASRALYLIAVRNSPRDRLAQAWLADDALRRGALPETIERIGLLVSMDGSLRPGLFAELARLARRADVRIALLESLARPTPWRADFLAALAEQGSDEAELDRLFLSLAEAGATLSPPERALWVANLVHQRRWTAAYLAWAGGVDSRRWEGTQGVFNGGFEAEPTGDFDWRVSTVQGSRIDTLATAGAQGNRALRVEFTGQRVDFANVEHWLQLSQGTYVFQIQVRLEDLRSDRGLAWRVYCLRDDTTLGSGPALRGTRAWHLSAFTFTVPEGCNAQRLRLELPARTAAEHMIGGVAWFDAAVVVPAPTAAPTQAAGGIGNIGASTAGVPAPQPSEPVALLARMHNQITVQRGSRSLRAAQGMPLLKGDVTGPHAVLRWRDDCERPFAGIVPARSPCAAGAEASPPDQRRSSQRVGPGRVLQIAAKVVNTIPNVAGNRDPDVPVGP